ncbi:MAG: YraN family protein [Elusimicrobia bacterium]|nr:YraN family protein [Elusimicrobiota bacterium]
MADTIALGKAAETEGAKYLQEAGYKIIDRNYSSPFGEIDVIAKEKNDIVFVEIKFRSSIDFGRPGEFVNKNKQSKILKTAIHYLKRKNLTKSNIRFDVLALGPEINQIELIKSAFDSPSLYRY